MSSNFGPDDSNHSERVDTTIYQILEKFQELFDKTIIQGKSKEVLATETITLESDTLTIIRLCKDLLAITRGLRETWCLGTMKVTTEQETDMSEEQIHQIYQQFNQLTDRIAELGKQAT